MTLLTKCIFEFLGTMVLILLGDGVCAGNSLAKTKGNGGGWVVITLAWGFAVMCGVFIAGPYSGAHLNPAVTLGLAIAGKFAWSEVAGYIVAQMLGGTTGYAINPARDLAPRVAHAVLPIKGKRDSGWGYSWIPVLAPICGGAFAALCFILLF